ncbi:hypothetical protein M501DRAFT_103940 [Patellaria atrata CBS 101060]|uniref:Aminoglycoside phosphotransferase domain-containing protein n=1 Tax=Patellaria atrata CBS 101060 TaxID=1346257 RepID=A0A9P4VVI0_9PEZI|nr:hypothetical protein M501DRAFT_103940 [Patellaria atrata CBS 101060]
MDSSSSNSGISDKDRIICDDTARRLYPSYTVTRSPFQGACSYTLSLSPKDDYHHPGKHQSTGIPLILQFRPSCYPLDMTIAALAKATYGSFAPRTDAVDTLAISKEKVFLMYEIERLNGVPYSSCQPQVYHLDEHTFKKQERLVSGFADFLSRGWVSTATSRGQTTCTGKVGSQLTARLHQLAQELPSHELRAYAQRIFQEVLSGKLDILPLVLNHGDAIPSNLMLDPDTFRFVGMVDWAESEMLPFGTCLYGLELLLGYMTTVPSNSSVSCSVHVFRYYEQADSLRSVFWERLGCRTPGLAASGIRAAVELARDVGVLLWYGFAWDGGKIDRVVDGVSDAVEVRYLEAFFWDLGEERAGRSSSGGYTVTGSADAKLD